MARYGERQAEATAKRAAFGGFTHSGSWFESEAPVRGALTAFVRKAIALRLSGKPPADIILALAVESPEVRAVFVPVAAQWSALSRFDQWGAAHTACSAHEAVKRGGKGA